MAEILLHIGTHKTGTTTLQNLMAELSRQLRERGILYPQAGRPLDPHIATGHHLLAFSLNGKRNVTDQSCWRQLTDEISADGAERVVVSTEEFDTLGDEQIRQVAEYLAGHKVTVTLYLRNPLALILSSYKQQVKGDLRCAKTFREFAAENIDRCNYAALAGRWSAAFGAEAMVIRLFDKVKKSPGLERDFLRQIGAEDLYDAARVDANEMANRSPSDDETRLLRLVNSIEARLPTTKATSSLCHRVRRRLIRGGAGRYAASISRWMTSPLCTEDDIEFVRRSAEQFNPQFARWLSDSRDLEFLTV